MPALATMQNSTNVRHALGLAWHRATLPIASALAPQSAVRTATRLFSTPPRFGHTARELEVLATGARFEVASPRGKLAAWRFGRADRPVILVSHGWGGRGAQFRAFVAPLTEAGYQVVLFDHVGHGLSEGSETTLIHFDEGLEAVARAVETPATPIVGVIGHSLGAAAVGAWLNQTGRAVRAVLIAAPTSVERYSKYFARRLGVSEPVRRAMQERLERQLGKAWREFELPHAVANVRAQALVIHDAADDEVAPSSGLALAQAWPGARFLATHGLGHRRILRDPGVVRDAIDFIAGRVVFAPPPPRGETRAFAAPAPLF
jgi:pimeloyl-ACP methyl ester carboxylesterase